MSTTASRISHIVKGECLGQVALCFHDLMMSLHDESHTDTQRARQHEEWSSNSISCDKRDSHTFMMLKFLHCVRICVLP